MTIIDVGATRAERLAALGSRKFDVLVIGGGITGCGIARDAALRGLEVALIERDDFASGTSSRSSRLIHGGVRYLEHGHLSLVFESSNERNRLLRLAPHLVRPLDFTWPVYSGARIPRWKLEAGLFLYDAIALFRNARPHRALSTAGILAHEPLLRNDGLRGGASYYDATTDDARLTLVNALGAAGAGATVLNHVAAHSLIYHDNTISGATVVDTLGGEWIDVHARVVVNASGPWSDDIQRMAKASAPGVRGSKGTHISIQRDRIGNRGALTLLAPQDGRVFFVLPAETHAIIGTTDIYTSSSPDEVRATAGEIQYLLDAANAYFPEARLTERDVIASWAGIRPLVAVQGSSPGSASREHAISISDNGLISITGGKLTTYRIMAAETVDAVIRQLGGRRTSSPTAQMRLPGGDLPSVRAAIDAARLVTNDDRLARQLVHSYGSQWRAVWEDISAGDGAQHVAQGSAHRIGEMRHAVMNEMACTLGDLLIRRTHMAFEMRDHGIGIARKVGEAVAPLLGWDSAALDRAVADYALEVSRIFTVEG